MSKNTSRTLIPQLMGAFAGDDLTPLLRAIRTDHTLSFEFRGPKAIAYYRGGKLFAIEIEDDGVLKCTGPTDGYLKGDHSQAVASSLLLPDRSATDTLLGLIPHWKWRMDRSNKLKLEIEFTQLLARENNWVLANTDYIICDLEYEEEIRPGKSARFDAVGIGWPAKNKQVRRKGKPNRLVLVEAKYRLNAIGGGSTAAKSKNEDVFGHFNSTCDFCSDPERVAALRQQAVEVFNQKIKLGLLNKKKVLCENLECFGPVGGTEVSLELLYVLGGCSPKTQKVTHQLRLIAEHLDSESRTMTAAGRLQVNIATGGLMGYGLFSSNIYGIREYLMKSGIRS